MKETELIDVQALQKEAKNSEHKESYKFWKEDFKNKNRAKTESNFSKTHFRNV